MNLRWSPVVADQQIITYPCWIAFQLPVATHKHLYSVILQSVLSYINSQSAQCHYAAQSHAILHGAVRHRLIDGN